MKNIKNKISIILILSLIFVTGCSSKKELKDGVYEGNYKDEIATVKVVITIKDKKIVDCVREERDNKNNKIKDENYGKDDADFNYKQAQKAVKNSEGYAKKLVEVQDIDKVDSVSGATVSYKRFKSAVKDALNK
ncbi:FMN-binding protein [Parvimonas sp. G1604]|uniref:FMN-binding protein n=1 Tax=Parvimonas sp. G1604 TaxID=3388845 RepID=UPI0039811530